MFRGADEPEPEVPNPFKKKASPGDLFPIVDPDARRIAQHWKQLEAGYQPPSRKLKVLVADDTQKLSETEKSETIELDDNGEDFEKDESGGAEIDTVECPSLIKFAVIVLAVSLAVFCTGLDGTIIPVVIPKITDEYKTMGDIGWYGSAYFLASAAAQFPYGKLYASFSIKIIFLYAMLIFGLGSLLCATAHTSAVFVAGRAIAGIGSGGVFTGALLIIRHSAPLNKRPMHIGVVASMMGLSNIVGLLIGGVIAEQLNWRYCFWINMPVSLAVSMALFLFMKASKLRVIELSLKVKLKRLDILGLIFVVFAITLLLVALTWGGTHYAWGNWHIIVLFASAITLLAVFVGVQVRLGDLGTIPPALLKRKEVLACSFLGFCMMPASSVVSYWLPVWFQEIKNVSPLESAEMVLPSVLEFALFGLLTGPCVTLVDYWSSFMALGSIFMAIGGGLLTTFHVNTTTPAWIGYQCLFGIGYGLGAQAPVSMLHEVFTNEHDVSMATSAVALWSNLGSAVALSIDEAMFSRRLTKLFARLLPDFADHQMTLTHAPTTK